MTRVVGVRFKHNGRIYYFDPGELDIQDATQEKIMTLATMRS